MPALLLTGAVGSGKTTVLREIGAVLEQRGEAYALVDLDWLCWLDGARISPREALAANLRAVWATYRESGVERLVLARGDVDVVRSVLDVVAVRLDVPRAELERRLRARDRGAELDEHLTMLDASAEVADAVVSGEGDPARSRSPSSPPPAGSAQLSRAWIARRALSGSGAPPVSTSV